MIAMARLRSIALFTAAKSRASLFMLQGRRELDPCSTGAIPGLGKGKHRG